MADRHPQLITISLENIEIEIHETRCFDFPDSLIE